MRTRACLYATYADHVDNPREPRTSRFGLFVLGFVVGALFGYWLHEMVEELAAMDGGYPFSYDGYVWIAALVIALVIVLRPRS